MIDKDKELNDMMKAIKNLKNQQNNHIENNDENFYTRNNYQKNPYKEENKDDNIKLNTNILNDNIHKYMNSLEFKELIQNNIKTVLLESLHNEKFLYSLMKEIITEYTNINDNIEERINILVKETISQIFTKCTNNLAESLKNI